MLTDNPAEISAIALLTVITAKNVPIMEPIHDLRHFFYKEAPIGVYRVPCKDTDTLFWYPTLDVFQDLYSDLFPGVFGL